MNISIRTQAGKMGGGPKQRPEDFLAIEPMDGPLSGIETPVPVIDLAIVERNVHRLQAHCDALGMANRPHIKTHKIAGLARFQIASGAAGITVQKLGEAEVMADAGIRDMLLTFNLFGEQKRSRLAALMKRTEIHVVADSEGIVAELASAAEIGGRELTVLVECDTGAGRAGVQTPEAAAALARMIAARQSLFFGGLMTYPKPGTRLSTAAFLAEAKRLCADAGLAVGTVTTGGSPDQWSAEGLEIATEYRAGTSIYCDRSLVARGMAKAEDCALSVHATVVSRPTPTRAIIDGGSKTFTSDTMGLEGFGMVAGHPDISLARLDEEHGYLAIPADSALKVGDRLAIIPNHVCPVSNLFDHIIVQRDGKLLGRVKVDARGRQS